MRAFAEDGRLCNVDVNLCLSIVTEALRLLSPRMLKQISQESDNGKTEIRSMLNS